MEKSYLEIKITPIHILILLISVFLIGIFLFYLGYQAGKSSANETNQQASAASTHETSENIKLPPPEEKIAEDPDSPQESSISEELRMHQQSATSNNNPDTQAVVPAETKAEPTASVKSETGKKIDNQPAADKNFIKKSYFAVQVGAFSTFDNAKKYSNRFHSKGYQIEILADKSNRKKLFKVRVGNFSDQNEAENARKKLEKSEKRKFSVIQVG